MPGPAVPIRAAFFDFGGVILSSPFEAFNGFEERNGLPRDLIRTINSTNPDTNAWARFERNEVAFDEFCDLFEAECREAGYEVAARELMPLLAGEIRPAMVEAVRRCRERLVTACLTNNWVSFDDLPSAARAGGRNDALGLFDHVIESSKVGVRKPDRAFYELACDVCEVQPAEVVFLDDLGVNLKPAAAMGMTTIKVVDPDDALAQLEEVVGFAVR
ncbi:MAG: HAD-IA family hydrolase [Acidimicrobiales bacterium]